MSNTVTTTGTSLEVLAPYLPYGIKIKTPDGDGKMTAIDASEKWGISVVVGISRNCYTPALCQPYLRSFAALCEPLEDGTVPAVEAARISGATDFFTGPFVTKIVDHPPMGRAVVVMNGDHEEARGVFWVYENKMAMIASWPCIVSDAWRYLRFHHFAVGLAPHQYIRKEPN